MTESIALVDLLAQIRSCTLCEDLPLGPNPVVRVSETARILIIGQAPGTKVHSSGIPWDDASGNNLRNWMGVTKEQFYDDSKIAIMPMGFCYPGRGKSGDLPPRKECAPAWHQQLLQHMPNLQLTLLVGQYAQQHYLSDNYRTLTERVQNWRKALTADPHYLPLVHPSPRNRLWMACNPWFEQELVPELRGIIAAKIDQSPG